MVASTIAASVPCQAEPLTFKTCARFLPRLRILGERPPRDGCRDSSTSEFTDASDLCRCRRAWPGRTDFCHLRVKARDAPRDSGCTPSRGDIRLWAQATDPCGRIFRQSSTQPNSSAKTGDPIGDVPRDVANALPSATPRSARPPSCRWPRSATRRGWP